jgi:hypothetical protein
MEVTRAPAGFSANNPYPAGTLPVQWRAMKAVTGSGERSKPASLFFDPDKPDQWRAIKNTFNPASGNCCLVERLSTKNRI